MNGCKKLVQLQSLAIKTLSNKGKLCKVSTKIYNIMSI